MEKKIPIKLEFDFTNKIDAFGAACFSKNGEKMKQLEGITVNMAAILWSAAGDPDLDWREMTADTVVHELLHAVQNALGRVFTEKDIDASIMRARGFSEAELAEIPSNENAADPYKETLQRAIEAEEEVERLRAEIEAMKVAK